MTYFAPRDLFESALAIFCFLPLFVAPGFLAGLLTNIAGFRLLSSVEQAAWSIPLSMGLVPLFSVGFGTFVGIRGVTAVYWLLAAAGVFLLIRQWRRYGAAPFPRERYSRLAFWTLAFWCAAALLQLVDLQWGHHLYVSVTVRDHCYRTAFIQAVLRSGVPPTNPLYYTGHPALMRNYYFLYVVCAVVCKATGIAARNVLVASCAWAAVGMFCAAALFCKYFLPPLVNLRRTALLSVFLFGVTGLDILMVLYLHFSTPIHRFDADMEWWDPGQFPSWLDSFLYVPHHVMSLVCCLISLLMLWTAGRENRRTRWSAVALSAVALTSAFGLSIYVAFAFAVTVAIWVVALLYEKERKLVASFVVSGLAAVVLCIPFLLQLHGETEVTGSKKTFPLSLQLRQLYGSQEWSTSLVAHHPFAAAHVKLARTFAWFAVALPDIALELGFFGLCGVLAFWMWRKGRFAGHPGMRALLILTGGSFFATMAVRSSITTINDYGMRSAMLPLFFLLIFAAYFLSEGLIPRLASTSGADRTAPRGTPELRRRSLQIAATVLLGLGAIGTVYQAIGIRFFLTLYEAGRLRDHRTNGAFPDMSNSVYQLREAYGKLAHIASPGAIVQYDPESIGSYFLYVNMINVGHQVVSAEPGCGKSFGGEASACPGIEKNLHALYADPPDDLQTAVSICQSMGIDYLVASNQEPAWEDMESWVWTGRAVVIEPDIRILSCR